MRKILKTLLIAQLLYFFVVFLAKLDKILEQGAHEKEAIEEEVPEDGLDDVDQGFVKVDEAEPFEAFAEFAVCVEVPEKTKGHKD